MKKILKLIPILFIALMMISCSDEAQSITSGSGSGGTQGPSDPSGGAQGPSGETQGPSGPSDETQYPSADSFDNVIDPDREVELNVGDGIPLESGLYDANDANGYTVYKKVKSEDPDENNHYENPYIPWNLTVGKDQIKFSIDRDALGEIISGVEEVPLFPRGLEIPEVLEINLLNSESIQKHLDSVCFTEYLGLNYPLALYPSETKTIEIESVSGLDLIKDNSEVSVKWYVEGDPRIPGNGEFTKADDGTISTITLKEVPITANYLYIEVVEEKEGDSSTIYEARIDDLYHPTNRDEVYGDVTVENAIFSKSEREPSLGYDERRSKAQLVSLNGRYVTDQADSPYYEITLGYLFRREEVKDGELSQENPYKNTVKVTLKKNGNSLILSEMHDSDENGTYDKEEKIGEFTTEKM